MAYSSPPFIKKKIDMKNSTIVLFIIWIALAILDIVALFTNVPLAFSIAFGVMNVTIILGSIPLFIQEFKDRKYQKYLKEEPSNEL